jgi:hypothetical protein
MASIEYGELPDSDGQETLKPPFGTYVEAGSEQLSFMRSVGNSLLGHEVQTDFESPAESQR